jgi:UDPglucose 6-dehydrogenase
MKIAGVGTGYVGLVTGTCLGADINAVRRGIGHDSRIGFAFLFPGAGYGGSCFPKDVAGLASVARQQGVRPRILEAVDEVNAHQKTVLPAKILEHFAGQLGDKTIAVWGLSFKPGTDDIREAPSLVLIDRLLEAGAALRVHDPEAMAKVRQLYGDRLVYCEQRDEAVAGADALAIMTEWKALVHPDLARVRGLMRRPVIFDGRNL